MLMSEFSVEVEYEKISIKKKTVLAIAIECNCHAYVSKRKNIKCIFKVESDAIDFSNIVSGHIPLAST